MQMRRKRQGGAWLAAVLLLLAAAGCDRSGTGDNVVARFKGGVLTIEDLEAHRRKMKNNPRFRRQTDMLTTQNSSLTVEKN